MLPTFDDEFNSLSLHRAWQAGDKWQLIAPDSPDGRGGPNWNENGTQWWVNPYNPNTPINNIYKVVNGNLQLGILSTPPAYQPYIQQQAGANMPYVGGLLNTSQTNYQKFGYYQLSTAVPRIAGFTFQADIENVQLTRHWPPEIDFRVNTAANNAQTVTFRVATSAGYLVYTTSSVNGFDPRSYHTYGWNWQSNNITFYIDGVQMWQTPNPGGVYLTDKQFLYLVTYANYPNGGNPNPASLPVYANLKYVRVYQNKPTAPEPLPVVILSKTSGGSITDASGNFWSLTSAGDVEENGTVVPGGGGTAAMTYVASTMTVWAEDAATLKWYSWTNGAWVGPASASPLPSIMVKTAGQPTVTVGATTAHIQTAYGATFSLTDPGIANVSLGSTADTITFSNMAGVTLTAGSVSEVIVANAGINAFTAGKGALDVTGGAGPDSYVFHAGDANLTIRDFSLSKGGSLTVDKSLQSSFSEKSDGHGGTLISFGTQAGHIDVTNVLSLPESSIHFV